jgi:FkbM family methyltransferase
MKLGSLPLIRRPGQSFLKKRVFRVQSGAGAGLKLRFPQNHDFITGTTELPVQREIASRLRLGDAFYDIGANIGFFSLIAGRQVGNTGSVCAFEPNPQNVAVVRENAQFNRLNNLRVFDVAIGRESRTDELLLSDWDGGGALAGAVVKPTTLVGRTKVQVRSLDDFITEEQLPPPTFVKIDVEGAELEVIQGMVATIARCAPTLLYEIDDQDKVAFERRWNELDAEVSKLGYQVTRLEDGYPNLNWNVGHSLAVPRNKSNG